MNDHRWSNERLVQRTTGLAGRGFRFGSRSMFGTSAVRWRHMAQIIELFPEIVSSRPSDETILMRDETISCFGADIWKQRMVIKPTTKRRATPALKTGDSHADPQLHPGLRLRAGPLGGRLVGQPAGHRHLRIQRLSHRHFTASGSRGCGQLIRTLNHAGKAIMFFRISAAAIVASFLIG